MLNRSITHVGLAALRTDQGVYVTQVFAAVTPPPAPPPEEEPEQVEEEEAPEAEPQDDCLSPIPGVSFCGPLPAPLIQEVMPLAPAGPRVEARPLPPPLPAIPEAAPAPEALPAPQAVAPRQAGPLIPQPGSNGTVLVERAVDNSRIQGYWVFGTGRWWYYPLSTGSRPGEQLRPDLTVTGPPPGYPAQPFAAPPAARPFVRAVPPPRAQVVVQPHGGMYAVPPPPMTNQADPNWRRAHARWERNYRRWLRYQSLTTQQAL
jgi:hypothetical protein